MVDRHAVGSLHHAQHELTRHHALLGHAEVAHIAFLLTQALCTDGGQVVEHHRQILVNQRAQQSRHAIVHRVLVIHQRIHAAQQLLVGECLCIDTRHADCLQPAQHPELGVRIAQPVEDHHPQGVLDGVGKACAAKHRRQAIEAQFVPELIKRPDIAQGQCGFKTYLGSRGLTQ